MVQLVSFQPPTSNINFSATMHSVRDGRTDRRQYHANSRSCPKFGEQLFTSLCLLKIIAIKMVCEIVGGQRQTLF